MSEAGSEGLLRVAEAVSDGTPVDWNRESSGQPEAREMLEHLSVVEKIRDVFQTPLPATRTADPSRPPDAAGRAASIPKTWGPLRILEWVGGGTFGDVYRAYDSTLDTEVALKLLAPSERPDRKSTERFISEARRLARVRHPNVVVVHGADIHDGRVGIWTDFVHGKTLEQLLRQDGPLGHREAALIGIDLCRALAAVHAAGLIHCDVKTTNVMREEGGRVLLMDFGSVSKAVGTAQATERSIHGTPIAMSPEQLRGEITPATDIYALGVLLYRLVSGRYPVEGSSFEELREKHERGEMVSLRDRRADLPTEFTTVVHRAIAADPKGRYGTAGEMEHALVAMLGASAPAPNPNWLDWLRQLRPEARIAIAASVFLALVLSGVLVQQISERMAGGTGSDASRAPSVTPAPSPSQPVHAPLTATVALHRRTDRGVEPLLPGGTISPGDRLYMDIQGSDSMTVYILNEDAEHNVYVLFPLRGVMPSNPLAPGTRYRLPGQTGDSILYWNVTSAGGREKVVTIAARDPLPSLEREIERFPRAAPGRRVTYGKMSPSVLHSLRGIGGLSAEGAPSSASRQALSEAIRALKERGGRTGELWVWEIQLENPVP